MPSSICERCRSNENVAFDDEQGFLCAECMKHFEEQRAKDQAEKEEEYDRTPYYPQDY